MSSKVLFVAAEALPLAKTGGLGDVVSALAAALHERGVDITLLMPGYPHAIAQAQGLRHLGTLESPWGDAAELMHGRMPDSGVPVILLQNDRLYDRDGGPYLDVNGKEYADNGERFAALCHAAADIAQGKSRVPVPDVVHAHDWHAGLTPLFLRQSKRRPVPSAITIHNLAFQGNFPMAMADVLGIPEDARGPDGCEFWGQASFLKAGIRYADRVTTVSESYAREILTPRFGCGLEGLLQSRADALVAIPNGVDTDVWDPVTDPLIAANYSSSNFKGKVACKRSLQQALNLAPDPFAPIMALGSRLTTQKMADVALHAIENLMARHERLQVAVLGSGDAALEDSYRQLALRYPGRVGVLIGYDERIAHILHAGADMLLHGSRFEPFGLTPVYSMIYGTVPIASGVGGLIDTVIDAGTGDEPAAGATGFLFDGEQVNDMVAAIERALDAFGQPTQWRTLQRNGMQAEFGWAASAEQYIQMYRDMTEPVSPHAFDLPEPAVTAVEAEPLRMTMKRA